MNNRTVILDPHTQFGYLLPLIESKGYNLLVTISAMQVDWQTVKEELYLCNETQKNYSTTPVVFYINRGNKQQESLKHDKKQWLSLIYN